MKVNRREFTKTAALAAASPLLTRPVYNPQKIIRLGGPVFGQFDDPTAWAQAHLNLGYKAAYCPVNYDDSYELIKAYEEAAAKADIVISEVGAWSNPISPNDTERKKAIEKNVNSLALADEIGAICCVNIAGSRGASWSGPHEDNLSSDTFDMIVETVRKIIDEADPKRSFYAIEIMPYTIPDSPESYLKLIRAVDRPRFACHLDPVNMISSPRRYFYNSKLLEESFELLGPYIKSCHAKDIILRDRLTVHLDEIRPGLGYLDYATYLRCLAKLDRNAVLMIEHLKTPEEYDRAADYIRSVAKKEKIAIS